MISSADVLFSQSQYEDAANGKQTGPFFPVGVLVGIVLCCLYGAMSNICRFQDRCEKNNEEINTTVCLVCTAIIISSVARFASRYPVGVAIAQELIFIAVAATLQFAFLSAKEKDERRNPATLTRNDPASTLIVVSNEMHCNLRRGPSQAAGGMKSQGILLQCPTKKQPPPLSLHLLRCTPMPATM